MKFYAKPSKEITFLNLDTTEFIKFGSNEVTYRTVGVSYMTTIPIISVSKDLDIIKFKLESNIANKPNWIEINDGIFCNLNFINHYEYKDTSLFDNFNKGKEYYTIFYSDGCQFLVEKEKLLEKLKEIEPMGIVFMGADIE